MDSITYIQFGRALADRELSVFFYQFVDRCIENFNLDPSKSDLLYDLANASRSPHSHLITTSMLTRFNIIERSHPHEIDYFLRSLGVEEHEMISNDQVFAPTIALSWSGVKKCFMSNGEILMSLIDQAIMIYVAYDAYDHQIKLNQAIDTIMKLENAFDDLSEHNMRWSAIRPIAHSQQRLGNENDEVIQIGFI